ncbi:peritrophin-1-like [Onthophagus taurus]|uniref:peritrophin-1-like n=1 Tax=Onthophagus taurus TaxID=166361 RepID=UPI0039BDB5CC
MFKTIIFTSIVASVVVTTTANYVDCPASGQHFYPHPYYCAKFIECNHGVEKVQTCFGDLIFNANLKFCDFPANYPCEDKIVPGPVGKCPAINGPYVDFLTHSTDCSIFYMCNWGIPIEMHCPLGLHFNPTINVCDFICSAKCTLETNQSTS